MTRPKARYPKADFPIFRQATVLSSSTLPKCVDVPAEHVGTCIVVHGVNDVGNSYQAVEEGLLEGLARRLGWQPDASKSCQPPYTAAEYRMPGPEDSKKLEADPDAVFFKRSIKPKTYSPVIPFYWGFRDTWRNGNRSKNGQQVDGFDNRLDLDRSKGGGPFANATTNLADMWNRGAPTTNEYVDWGSRDPYRPLRGGPGRMYFVLAAQRLAALVAMIRDYGDDVPETVNIIAHSQGCLVSLLAQAFLMEEGEQPADTLILTHPPYGLEAHVAENANTSTGNGNQKNKANNKAAADGNDKKHNEPVDRSGEDSAMQGLYEALEGLQSVRARLDTLINIVRGVAAKRKQTWSRDELERMKRGGLHSKAWDVAKDRDNRGKVYLYFCPEDMTVALPNVQGIGWQGVPSHLVEQRATGFGKAIAQRRPPDDNTVRMPGPGLLVERKPLEELGPHFKQRVFTRKVRKVGNEKKHFEVGLPPQKFILREEGEDDRAHAATTTLRSHLPEHTRQFAKNDKPPITPHQRTTWRLINGEALEQPYVADLFAGAVETTDKTAVGKFERVDPIDAAIAVTSDYGIDPAKPQVIADPRPGYGRTAVTSSRSPVGRTLAPNEVADVEAHLNEGKPEGDRIKLSMAATTGDGSLVIHRNETPNEARLRHQQATSARSFHGAIWGSKANHAKVTAYDIAIGRGRAVTDPGFYRYLCAVADWRLKKPDPKRPNRDGILSWDKFSELFDIYLKAEAKSRVEIIEGNSNYYSNGILPKYVKSIAECPKAVVTETTDGRTPPSKPAKGEK